MTDILTVTMRLSQGIRSQHIRSQYTTSQHIAVLVELCQDQLGDRDVFSHSSTKAAHTMSVLLGVGEDKGMARTGAPQRPTAMAIT